MKRKITATLIAIMLSMSMCINVSASYDHYTYTIENKTVIFNSDTPFDAETREYVAKNLAIRKSVCIFNPPLLNYILFCLCFIKLQTNHPKPQTSKRTAANTASTR